MKINIKLHILEILHLFNIDTLGFDIGNHDCVPEHKCIRKTKDINDILEKVNANETQLPGILRTDPMAKLLRLYSVIL